MALVKLVDVGSWAKVELSEGDIVADLADRACTKFRSWDADASQVSLHRVEWTGAGDPDAASERAALSAKPLPSSLCLEETRGGPRLFILVRKTAGAAAASAGGGIDFAAALASALASALAPVLTGVADLRRRADLSDLRRLYVQAAVSTGGSSRSPRKEERLELKAHVLDYYGLRVPGDAERSCFTHLGGAAVPFERATMAHVWPSAEADAAGLLADELRLPRSFHLDPRNFLILPLDVHHAFDSGWLLLIPSKDAAPGSAARVFMRASRVDAVVVHGDPASAATREKRAWLRSLDGSALVFKNDNRPFMRVLGWRAWTMRGSPDDDAASRAAEDAASDAGSVDAEGNVALRMLTRRGAVLQRGGAAVAE